MMWRRLSQPRHRSPGCSCRLRGAGKPFANPMNKAAALISLGIGGAFLALEVVYPYRAAIFGSSIASLVNVNQSKARAAVASLLYDPNSAQFDGLRDVEVETVNYVCGDVKAKDRAGSYSASRAFVYEVKPDIARIDDDEQIARAHARYKPCPEDINPSLSQPLDLEKARQLLKLIPKADPQTLATLKSSFETMQLDTGGGGKDLKSALGEFRSRTVIGQLTAADAEAAADPNVPSIQAEVSFAADLKNEREWRDDRPPAAWPKFPSDDPLARPARKLTPQQAIALASDVEARWNSFKAGRSAQHPRSSQIEEALRALLSIEPRSVPFPKAWALFVRLRQIDREAVAIEAAHKATIGPARPRG